MIPDLLRCTDISRSYATTNHFEAFQSLGRGSVLQNRQEGSAYQKQAQAGLAHPVAQLHETSE